MMQIIILNKIIPINKLSSILMYKIAMYVMIKNEVNYHPMI